MVKVAKLAVPRVSVRQLSDEEYSMLVSEIKAEMLKKEPDVMHLKELAHITYVKCRSWISSTPSHKLSMAGVLDQFLCFRLPDILLQGMVHSVSG